MCYTFCKAWLYELERQDYGCLNNPNGLTLTLNHTTSNMTRLRNTTNLPPKEVYNFQLFCIVFKLRINGLYLMFSTKVQCVWIKCYLILCSMI